MRSNVSFVMDYGEGGKTEKIHTIIHKNFKDLLDLINFLLPAGFSVEKIKTSTRDPGGVVSWQGLDEATYDYLTEDDAIRVTCAMGMRSMVQFLVTNEDITKRALFERPIVHGSYDDLYGKIERECSPGQVQDVQIILEGAVYSVKLSRRTYDRVKDSKGIMVVCKGKEVPRITNGPRQAAGRLAEAILSLDRRIKRLEVKQY